MSGLSRLTACARRGAVLTLLLFVSLAFLCLFFVVLAVLDPAALGRFLVGEQTFGVVDLSATQGLSVIGLHSLPVLIWLMALSRLVAMFRALERAELGQLSRVANCAQSGARWILWALIGALLQQPLTSLVITWQQPVGERVLALSLGTWTLSGLLAALMCAVLALALRAVAELWEDNAAIV